MTHAVTSSPLETVRWTASPAAPSVSVRRPDTPEGVLPFLYVHLGTEEADMFHVKQTEWEQIHGAFPAVLIAITGNDWERDFTPWPSPHVFRGGRDFTGGADAYLQQFTGELVPAVEAALQQDGLVPSARFLAGYSLAGLFALYALYKIRADGPAADYPFAGCVCGSPSVWYPEFREFALTEPLPPTWRYFYGSVGDREGKSKNPRLAPVEDNLRAITDRLQARGIQTAFVLNEGGHFNDPAGRLWQGLCQVLRWTGSDSLPEHP
ncbi:MAG: Alpha/beta hydrolase [Succiniclasticum sp.]|jgi:predicted alpha/beta superfamily hydrolase